MLYELLRPLLFRLDPETAHHLSLAALQGLSRLGSLNPLFRSPTAGQRTVMGLTFPNPVGLAAGLDKNGECIDGLAALGFGFIEIGTVTPRPQPGNPKPRLFRLPEAEALINRMGFNNKGVDYLVEQVKKARYRGILGINIGKNRDTPLDRALDDYLIGLRKVYPYASYVTVNISSPNTPGLRDLQAGENLEHLLFGLRQERENLAQTHGRRVPLAVKIAPDLESDQVKHLADALVKNGIDAVIATNTTASREGVEGLTHSEETGGLSGRPLFGKATDVVAHLAQALRGAIPIIACGGIVGAEEARRKFEAGADLIQIYTGFIYRGPTLVKEIVKNL
ncbi:quinone-dependent dihydroorotate dehydrogenase [Methylocaldum sp.]|uniref:quinone-dependent dihydroorotate dehydrogenase n=1 Tax=Methylocaldum sp. TaxID=1969727 RepID=UPI002D6BF30E|nr:quinone-dependent dihydroorotate dehydrogenase [Methylocaldum sp.]HYE36882.1 quinone-dependent dihydroorotate dehydrogenase [Methylocaldum sp.]